MPVSGERTSTAPSHDLSVTCMSCGRWFAGTSAMPICPECGGLLDADFDLERTLTPIAFDATKDSIASKSGVWRYRGLLPSIPDESIVTRFEGNTPLYWSDRITDYAGLKNGRTGWMPPPGI